MGLVGEGRRARNTRRIELRGEPATLNGETIPGLWQNAGIIAIQRFLRDTEWALSSFEVRLPAYAMDAPYSVRNGMEFTRVDPEWRCLVRNVTVEKIDNVIIQVNVICVETTE